MQFLYPNVLFLMLIPTILLIFLLNTKKSAIQTQFDPDILNALSAHSKGLNKTTRNYLFFIALLLMIVALSRPVINEKEQTIKQETIPLIVAIDISKSMYAQDVYPNRLLLAKQKLETLLQQAKNYSIGVILFGQSSFIVSPLTQDFNSLKQMIKGVDFEQPFSKGSNISAMLEASQALLKEYNNKNVLILSDGGNKHSYEKEIAYAKEHNLRIYTLNIATNKPTPIPTKNGYQTNSDGTIVMVKQNDAIKELSLQNKGGYIQFSTSSEDISQIISDITAQSSKESQASKTFKTYTELFYYPLACALFLLFIAYSSLPKLKRTRNAVFVFLGLSLAHYTTPAAASILDFKTLKDAKEAYSNQAYEKSAKLYEDVASNAQGYYNLGNAYYKQKKYKKAIEAYKKVVTEKKDLEASKLHNLGNSYAKLGALKEAEVSYENALKLKYDEETKKNLDAVKEAMKDKKENHQNKQNKNDQKDDTKNQDKKNQQENQNKNQKNSSQNESKKSKEKEQNGEPKSNKEQTNKSSQKTKEDDEKQKSQALQQNEISDLEEKKWLKKLQEQGNKTFIRKFDAKNQEEREGNPSTPW